MFYQLLVAKPTCEIGEMWVSVSTYVHLSELIQQSPLLGDGFSSSGRHEGVLTELVVPQQTFYHSQDVGGEALTAAVV